MRLDRRARDVVSASKRHSGNDELSRLQRIGTLEKRGERGAKGSIEARVYRMCASLRVHVKLSSMP
jgi:hypothetical protein